MKRTVAVIMLSLVLLWSIMLCTACGEESERNKIGSSIDWGEGKYWNSDTESVEDTIFD